MRFKARLEARLGPFLCVDDAALLFVVLSALRGATIAEQQRYLEDFVEELRDIALEGASSGEQIAESMVTVKAASDLREELLSRRQSE